MSASRKAQASADLGVRACHIPGSDHPATHGRHHAVGTQLARSQTPVKSPKSFLDQLGPQWKQGFLAGKVGGAFAVASWPHGGSEVVRYPSTL